MISFRYLVVTIVAIFLALGLGVLVGTTVLDQGIVKTYKNRTHALEDRVAQQQTDLNELNAFLSQLVPRVVEGRLAHREIVLVTDSNADGTAVSAARDYLSDSGANVVAQLAVTSSLGADDPSGSGLSKLLDVSGSSPFVTEAAARKLANRLESGPPVPTPATGEPIGPDLLKGLLDGGFLIPQHGAPDVAQLGGLNQSVVVVAGGQGDPAVPFAHFVIPFVEQLVKDGVPVAAAQPTNAERGFVGLLRKDPALTGQRLMVTVDDLADDTPFGGVALVLGLKDMLVAQRGGAYGEQAPTLVPELPS